MRLVPLLLGLAMMTVASAAHAEGAPGTLHVVTYVEVAPASANAAAVLLRQYCDATRKESGDQRCNAAQELGRASRFVILEIWKDQAAFEAHGKSAATAQLRDKLKPIAAGPLDERVHNAFAVGPNDSTPKGAIYVASHVDVPPPKKDDVIAALNPLAEASRKAPGNLRFEVVQQTSRPNHFTVIEAWQSQKAYDARVTAAPQRTFRDTLGPMLGALYDERLYRALD